MKTTCRTKYKEESAWMGSISALAHKKNEDTACAIAEFITVL